MAAPPAPSERPTTPSSVSSSTILRSANGACTPHELRSGGSGTATGVTFRLVIFIVDTPQTEFHRKDAKNAKKKLIGLSLPIDLALHFSIRVARMLVSRIYLRVGQACRRRLHRRGCGSTRSAEIQSPP